MTQLPVRGSSGKHPGNRYPSDLAVLVFIVVAAVAVVGAAVLRAELVYDDWTCALAKCVKLK